MIGTGHPGRELFVTQGGGYEFTMPVQFGFDLLTEIQGVQFRFASAAKNHNGWRVQSVSWSEAISGLYSVELTLSAEFPAPDASTMLGENASLEITRGDETRLVHGIVESVADGAWSSANTTAIVTLVPALALLQHRSHARISRSRRCQRSWRAC